MLVIEAAAVVLKVAVVAPADTVTDTGTVSEALLLASVTLDPPAGAARVSVRVHVLTVLTSRLGGVADDGRDEDRCEQTERRRLRTGSEGRR